MLTLKVPLKDAEKARKSLLKRDLLRKDFLVVKEKGFIFYPVVKRFSSKHDFVEKRCSKRKKQAGSLREVLKRDFTKKEMDILKTAFDSIGNIATLEIDEKLLPKAKIIAKKLIEINKSIETVLMKSSFHGGEFRTQKFKWLAGKKSKSAEYKENNIILRFDVEKVYFSIRLSTERKRIMQLVKPGEDVIVLFSGCAPYPCVIAKNTKAKEVWGVEKNPEGHKWGLENIKNNNLKNVKLFCADVKDFSTKKRFDRILMPLPKSAKDFLDQALKLAKKNAVIHFYDFQHRDDFKLAKEKVKKACKRHSMKCRILRTVKCGQHAPRVFRICVDFRVSK